ncbi:hypothetical protein HGRIS_010965 [Hohenbuehelia grisea]|uniref:Uncharacterized protein n=1 Tax=Hohenbuehelia grisea TaxID=104357 RepID=A0ABR3IYP1_9AGAR
MSPPSRGKRPKKYSVSKDLNSNSSQRRSKRLAKTNRALEIRGTSQTSDDDTSETYETGKANLEDSQPRPIVLQKGSKVDVNQLHVSARNKSGSSGLTIKLPARKKLVPHISETPRSDSPHPQPVLPSILDPFDIRLDRVSYKELISDGEPSLEAINNAIDQFVSSVLGAVNSWVGSKRSRASKRAPLAGSHQQLLDLLQTPSLLAESRDPILDVLLHERIATTILHAFYQFDYSVCLPMLNRSRGTADDVYDRVRSTGESV